MSDLIQSAEEILKKEFISKRQRLLRDIRGTGVIWSQGPDWEDGKYSSPNVKIVARTQFGENPARSWDGCSGEEFEANARLIAAAPELLDELKLANKIIMNALNVMTTEQKDKWDELNTRDNLKDGMALTRNGARETVIRKAEGRSDGNL